VDNANSILLNRFFTRNTFKQVIDDGESPAYIAAIRRYIVDPAEKTNGECISEIYQYLKKEYQNEYFYKNTLLNKLLLGIHSPRTTTALTEVPVGNSKADFILLNGKAVVYEIKTELDTFDRLETQMMPGNGKLTCTGIGSGKEPKEATNTAFNYLKANGNRISGRIQRTP